MVAQISLHPERKLLYVGGVLDQVSRKARRQNGKREAGSEEVLIYKDRGTVVGIESLLCRQVVQPRPRQAVGIRKGLKEGSKHLEVVLVLRLTDPLSKGLRQAQAIRLHRRKPYEPGELWRYIGRIQVRKAAIATTVQLTFGQVDRDVSQRSIPVLIVWLPAVRVKSSCNCV